MFIIKLLVCLFVKLTITKADYPDILPVILYGTKARIEDYPFFAATEVCGASILSERWLLTAAHCVDNWKSIANKLVFVGGERLDNSIRLRYDQIVIHPRYKTWIPGRAIAYDIALLRLQTPLMFSSKVKAVKLPTQGISSGLKYLFIGRGLDETNRHSLYLMKMDVVQISTEECIKSTPIEYHPFLMDQSILCGRKIDGRPGLCFGDSGSPLLQGNTIVGLASFLIGRNCHKANIGYYTNVAAYVPWIKTVTGLK